MGVEGSRGNNRCHFKKQKPLTYQSKHRRPLAAEAAQAQASQTAQTRSPDSPREDSKGGRTKGGEQMQKKKRYPDATKNGTRLYKVKPFVCETLEPVSRIEAWPS